MEKQNLVITATILINVDDLSRVTKEKLGGNYTFENLKRVLPEVFDSTKRAKVHVLKDSLKVQDRNNLMFEDDNFYLLEAAIKDVQRTCDRILATTNPHPKKRFWNFFKL